MEKFYRISCIVMGVLLLAALGVTVWVGLTGGSPEGSRAGLIAVTVCLTALAVITVLALSLWKIGGRLPYKIGFYILHAGLVVLIAGCVITSFGTVDNRVSFTADDGQQYRTAGQRFYTGQPCTDVKVGALDLLNPGDGLILKNVRTEYYEDNGMPKYYEAALAVYDAGSGLVREEKTLSVNHPARIRSFKIYLMDVQPGSALLYIKFNPGEYVVLIGIALLVGGTSISCFSGFMKKRDKRAEKGGERK